MLKYKRHDPPKRQGRRVGWPTWALLALLLAALAALDMNLENGASHLLPGIDSVVLPHFLLLNEPPRLVVGWLLLKLPALLLATWALMRVRRVRPRWRIVTVGAGLAALALLPITSPVFQVVTSYDMLSQTRLGATTYFVARTFTTTPDRNTLANFVYSCPADVPRITCVVNYVAPYLQNPLGTGGQYEPPILALEGDTQVVAVRFGQRIAAVLPSPPRPMTLPARQPITRANADELRLLATLAVGAMEALAWSPDGQRLYVLAQGAMQPPNYAPPAIHAYEMATLTSSARYELPPTGQPYPLIPISIDGLRLAYADGRSLVLPLGAPHELRQMVYPTPDFTVSFSAEGEATLQRGATYRAWQVVAGVPAATIGLSNGIVDWRHDRPLQVGAYFHNEIRGSALVPAQVCRIAFSDDGRWLAVATSAGDVYWYQGLSTDPSIQQFGDAEFTCGLAMSADASVLVTSDVAGALHVWDRAEGKTLLTLAGHDGGIPLLSFNPDHSLLASMGEDGRLRLWGVTAGEPSARPYTGAGEQHASECGC